MTIALAPFIFTNNDLAANMAQMERGLSLARGRADLLCFGEAFLQGFDAMNWDYAHDRAVAVTQDSAEIRRLCALTQQYGVDLLFGYLERTGDLLYSSCMLIQNGAVAHNYRQISRGWKEYWHTDSHYCEGDAAGDFCYRGKTFRIALCGDLWDYPERFQTEGILLWPVCCNYTQEEWERERAEYAAQAFLAARRTLYVDAIDSGAVCPRVACCFEDGKAVAELCPEAGELLYIEV